MSEDIPINHLAAFAPVVRPTLTIGTAAFVLAARCWLGPSVQD